MRKYFIPGVFLVLLAALLAMGCGKEPASSSEPQVKSEPDNFQFQATGASGVTFTKEVSWENSGDSATVSQTAEGDVSGLATVSIMDSGGKVVYSGNLAESGTFGTGTGAPGTWTILVAFTNVSGTVAFQVLGER